MKVVLIICIGLFLLATSHCGKPSTKQSSTSTTTTVPSNSNQGNCQWKGAVLDNKQSALQSFLVGKWEGREWPEQEPVMTLTFQGDGNAIIDYSVGNPKGRVFSQPYRIKDEKTITICGYNDDFIIIKHLGDAFDLKSDRQGNPVAIELIYTCKFVRANN